MGEDVLVRFLQEAGTHLAPLGRIYLGVPAGRKGALAAAEDRFRVRVAARKSLFFETLLVLELTHPL